MAELNPNCNCPNTKCPRHGNCMECVEFHKADGKKISAIIGVRKIPVETQVDLSYDRGKASWKKTVSVGTEIDLNGEKYLVRKLNAGAKGCEVTVENAKTKKQKVIR